MNYSVEFSNNWQSLSQEEWDYLLSILNESEEFLEGHSSTASEITSDEHISEEEIEGFLDRNMDGEITVRDFGNFSSHVFNKLENVLSKYNYDLVSHFYPGYLNHLDFYIQDVPAALWSNVRFVTEALKFDPLSVMHFVPSELKGPAWEGLISSLEEESRSFPDSMRRYSRLARTLREMNITHPGRLGEIDNIATVITNREVDRSDTRPIALMIFAKALQDEIGRGGIHDIINSGIFRVLYYEAETDNEVEEIIRNVFHDYGRQIHTLWLSGHGYQYFLRLGGVGSASLGGRMPLLEDEENNIDYSDWGLRRLIGEAVAPNGQVVVASCYTGAGQEGGDNLANAIATDLHRGTRVLSLTGAQAITGVEVDSNGYISISHADFNSIYITHGQLPITSADLDATRGLFHDPDADMREDALNDYYSFISQLPHDDYLNELRKLLSDPSHQLRLDAFLKYRAEARWGLPELADAAVATPFSDIRMWALEDYLRSLLWIVDTHYFNEVNWSEHVGVFEGLLNDSDEDIRRIILEIYRILIARVPAEAWSVNMGVIETLLGVSDPDLHREVVKISWELNRLFPAEVQEGHPAIMEALLNDARERIDNLTGSLQTLQSP